MRIQSSILLLLHLPLRGYTYFYGHRGYMWPKTSRHLFFHEKDLQKISQYPEILFGEPILCSNRFCSNLFSDCLFITIYSDENIPLENFIMSLLGHVFLRRVINIQDFFRIFTQMKQINVVYYSLYHFLKF